METKANMKRMRQGKKPRKYKFKDRKKWSKEPLVPILFPPQVATRNMDDVVRQHQEGAIPSEYRHIGVHNYKNKWLH